ncbi:MAG TPA: Crp/Fnr family transcriptional regulator [Ktedonobacteraceae bacterium]|nr:Crp/Fnr family transcriptional regulator [Ktedonobacteraceae bacterium]
MRLDIYIAKQSPGLPEVHAVAQGANQLSGLEVFLVPAEDLEPMGTFAVVAPLYVLDGQLLAWGVSSVEALLTQLRHRHKTTAVAQQRSVPQIPHQNPHSSDPFPLATSAMPMPALTLDMLSDLGKEDLRKLFAQMPRRTYTSGRFIFWQDEAVSAAFLLRQGHVQLSRLTQQGKRWELGHVRPGMLFGEVALLGETASYTSAEVVDEALVSVLSRPLLDRLMREHPSVALRVNRYLSRQLMQNAELLEGALFRDASARLAATLIQQSQEARTLLLWLTHEQLGASTGLLRETVTKVLDMFQQAGLVRLRRNQVQLLEVSKLQTLLQATDTSSFLRRLRDQTDSALDHSRMIVPAS